jgi:hypothetical protein
MSYEIIYDKQFIKLSNDRFIPIVLGGSNNCTEFSSKGRERRARSWDNLNIGESKISTLEQMLNHSNELRERLIVSNNESTYRTDASDYYNDNRFGWFCGLQIGSGGTSRTSFKMYQNLFVYGCKNALSVEELQENFINVRVFSSPYSKVKIEEKGLETFSKYFETTNELENFIIEKENLFKDNNVEAAFYITYSMSEDALYWMRKKKKLEIEKEQKPKQEVEISEAYVIKIDSGYFHKRTKTGFKYSSYSPKYWNTEKEVKAVMNRIKKDSYLMQFNPIYKLETLTTKRKILV